MKWMKHDEPQRIAIKSWCQEVEPKALQQACNLAQHPALEQHVALMPDCHVGYGMPIGGVVAAKNAVLPAAVGVDIGCGMVAVETNVPVERLASMSFRRQIQDVLKERIPVGDGMAHKQVQEWDGFERYLDTDGHVADFVNELDRRNLGTLGGGNHFVEIQESDTGFVWLMIHSGSRNLGKRVEEWYLRWAQELMKNWAIVLPDPDLAYLPMDELDGQEYFRDMSFAMDYAQENRRRMMAAMKQTLLDFVPEAQFLREVNIHHNYAALEEHFGQKVYVHRKGATSAKLDEIGIIPGSMGTASYIVRGLGNPESFTSCSHGAGRRMSRVAACTSLTVAECDKAMAGIVCERWHKAGGRRKGSGYDLSEAPQAYKSIDEVISSELDLIEPLVRLKPLAVLKG